MAWQGFRTLALVGAALGLASPAMGQESGTAAPTLAVPTTADFGALPFITGPVLSPDGNRIAARALSNGKPLVVVIDLSKQPNALTNFPLPENHELEWVRWAGNGRLLVSLSRAAPLMGEEVRLTRLAMIDLATNATSLIGPREQGVQGDNVIHVDRDGKFVLLNTQPSIYEWPEVYRIDLDTGKARRVVGSKEYVWDWFADPSGVVRGGVGVNGTRWWITYRSNDKEDFKTVVRRDARRDENSDDGLQQFAPILGADEGYVVANGKTGHFALYRYDFKNDALGEMVYENPSVDIDDFSLARDGTLRAVYYTDDRAEIEWFDPDLKKLQARIDRALPGQINRIVSMSEDKLHMLIWTGGADDPGAYMIYDRSANRMDLLAEPYNSMRGKRLAAVKPVRYKARDGLEIRAYLTLPPGKESAKGLPMVVMPHGGPFARDEWAYDPWVQYLATKGYAVLQPNFRGSTGFGRAFVERGNGQWGRGMQDDIDDGVAWLASQGTVDDRRVCIMGASFGGYAAMWAAVRDADKYRCAISFAGVSDIASMLRYDQRSFSATRYFRDWRDRVKGDKSFDLDQISPLKQVDRLTVPILLAHGSKDDNVPPYQSRRLHDALAKLGRDHEYVVYEGEGHGFADPAHSIDFLNRVGKFLDKYNPAN